jgi:hypothetical protein
MEAVVRTARRLAAVALEFPVKKKSFRNLAARAFRRAAWVVDTPEPPKCVVDEFVTQLCYVNAGIMERGNVQSFEYAIAHLSSSAPILEIGSLCGLSTNTMAHFKRKHRKTNPLITCDKWKFQQATEGVVPTHVGDSPVLMEDFQRFARDTYIRNIQMFSATDLPYTFEMFSDEFFAAWRSGIQAQDVLGRELQLGGPFSFCFVDGNHTYDFAKRDFLNCDAFLEVGGFILFDDSTLLKDGVYKVMPGVMATGRYELIAMNPNHLFQKKA